MSSLSDSIFPGGEPRDGHILRLELVASWESQFLGLGRLTRFIIPRLLGEAAAVDDMGVNIVFLQRHRVEVGLKLILERAGGELIDKHNIDVLWDRCAQACSDAGFSALWDDFDLAQKEFGATLNLVDPGASTFRYPVDRRNQPWRRGPVDLARLEEAGAAFERDLLALIRELAAAEPLPIAPHVAPEAAEELRSLIAGCNGMVDTPREVTVQLRQQLEVVRSLIPGPRAAGSGPDDDGFPELEAISDVTEPLAGRLQDLLDRIVSTYGLDLDQVAPVEPVGPAPRLVPFASPAQVKKMQDAQIRWFVDQLVKELRPLAKAVEAVYHRSESWSTPAARQIHLDVARFRSRLGHPKTP
jgi:hypothetical protein